MKMIGFGLLVVAIGLAIAAYIKLPKTEENTKLIKLFKFVVGIIVLSAIGIFTLAALGSTTSIKLF